MNFDQAIKWAQSRAVVVAADQARTEKDVDRLRADIAEASGKLLEKLAKRLKRQENRLKMLPKAHASWLKLAAVWTRGERARLKVSFSGGKSSGLMARRIKNELGHLFETVFVFCNTGREDNRTLDFVDKCDKAYGLNLTWLEAVVFHDERRATGHRVVTYETASRLEHGDWNPNGWPTPFLEVVKKYGIPNMTFQPCNRELKLNTMDSYLESIGWDDYFSAVGIRKDEDDRLDEVAGAFQIFYPLAQLWPTDKEDVAIHWEDQPFHLDLTEERGNCVDCHKKHKPKLFVVYSDTPEVFEFDLRIEREFAYHGAPHYGVKTPDATPRVRFRGNTSTEQLIAEAKALGVRPVIPVREGRSMAARQYSMDFERDGCSESCEAFPQAMMEIDA